uniref:Uncharacterized protein n=1 Tax=Mycolicibacterium gilvum (strain PYR-GCK) TaxID=350054 RepID=A4T502_MYCGI|nr:conserved hypothetical protein [Mycolicibacterium gilvum PYR-GCK]
MSTPPGDRPPPPPGPPPGYPGGSPWGAAQPNGPRGRGAAVWVLGGLAVLVVIVLTVAATLFVTGRQSEEAGPDPAKPSPTTAVDTSEIASADDDGPVEIITEDPTCSSWTTIVTAFVDASRNGWDARDPTSPAASWTPEQSRQYEAMGAAMQSIADRTVELAKRTPHRVMRILYEQFVAYSRAYVGKLSTYTEQDDRFVRVAISFSGTLNAICDSIAFGAAGARAPLVPGSAPPRDLERELDPDNAKPFMTSPSSSCGQWLYATEKFTNDTAAWRGIDPNIPASELTADQRAVNAAVAPVMEAFATESQQLGRRSNNPIWADLAALSAQYRRAYVSALVTYSPSDNDLQVAAGSTAGAISEACRIVMD